MLTIIKDFNNKLMSQLNELKEKQIKQDKLVNEVNQKIASKVDEANDYKESVDNLKEKIDKLSNEIETYEKDLIHLKERFSGKDLDAVLDAGEKEINNKIVELQKEITSSRENISEYTEKARAIKDLLINLKRDKTEKEEKLSHFTSSFEYYNDKLEEIIEYSKNNYKDLIVEEETKEEIKLDVPKEELKEESEVVMLDEIVFNEAPKVEEIIEEEIILDEIIEEEITKEDDNKLTELVKEIPKQTAEEISKSIDEEFSNIFGFELGNNVFDEPLDQPEKLEDELSKLQEEVLDIPLEVKENIFDTPEIIPETDNIFSITEEELNSSAEDQVKSTENDVDNFFPKFNLELSKFNDITKVKENYDLDEYSKVLNTLKSHNINLEAVYEAPEILSMKDDEINEIISSLLLGGQNTNNISLILNTLNQVAYPKLQTLLKNNNNDLTKFDIADIIMRVKK